MTGDARAGPADPEFDPAAVSDALGRGLDACTAWKRTDLAAKLRLAQVRLARPATLVCVVGEYKQGKSLLIDALVGSDVCPVDDDLATSAITAVYGAETPAARVRRVVDGRPEVEEIPLEQVRRYVTEQGDPVDRAGVELVEVGVPSSTLEGGLTLVDTPGVGGILHQHTATTLRFLGLTDGVVFVTDASQELTAPEVAFLEAVREVCPTVLVVVSKVDLYPEWRRILESNVQHLSGRGIDVAVIPVSSTLRMEALARGDDALEGESGIADLLGAIRQRVLAGARRRGAARALDELRWTLGRLLEPIRSELTLLEDPAAAEEGLQQLRSMQERLRGLQEAGSRWSTLLNDGFTDLRSGVDHRLRTAVRALLGWVDTRLEEIDPASDWEPFTREVQEQVSRAVAEAFEAVEDGAETIRDRIDALLEDEEVVAPDLGAAQGLDAAALWAGAERELRTADGHRITRALSTGLTALRGSSSGMILLGMMGNLAGVALAAPVSVGVAVFFGGKQFLDTRKTALRQRRQEARSVIRQYVDESNLELSNRVRQLIQDHHRTLRDHYSARLQELSRSTGAALQAAQESLAGDRASREQRAEQLRQWASRLERELAALAAIEGEVSG